MRLTFIPQPGSGVSQEEQSAVASLALHSLKDPEVEVARRAEALERHRQNAIEILGTLVRKPGVVKA